MRNEIDTRLDSNFRIPSHFVHPRDVREDVKTAAK